MVTLRAISAKMNRNRKKPIETRKLTQQQKKLLVEKIKELEDSYTGRGKISSEKLAKIIGPRFLKRSISYKIVQKYRKKEFEGKLQFNGKFTEENYSFQLQ